MIPVGYVSKGLKLLDQLKAQDSNVNEVSGSQVRMLRTAPQRADARLLERRTSANSNWTNGRVCAQQGEVKRLGNSYLDTAYPNGLSTIVQARSADLGPSDLAELLP